MSTIMLSVGRITAGCVRRCLIKPPSLLRLTSLQPVTVGLRSSSSVIDRSQYSDRRLFSSVKPNLQKQTVTIHFVLRDGKKKSATAKLGDNLLDVVLENDVDIDGYGACEGTLACSTCHLVFKQDQFEKLSNKPTDEELDMLDLAYGLSDTSRLGCQVIVTKEMDGWEIVVPSGVADARSV